MLLAKIHLATAAIQTTQARYTDADKNYDAAWTILQRNQLEQSTIAAEALHGKGMVALQQRKYGLAETMFNQVLSFPLVDRYTKAST
ncbi:hypothetical protein [Flavobacterium caeni]|uniref:hypothetical protein n=1 Tax=Flavobacterium caeni TaxID=490189 RepID=UPI000B83948D|nr:hypothetical protein [Flavobacterium caeni]